MTERLTHVLYFTGKTDGFVGRKSPGCGCPGEQVDGCGEGGNTTANGVGQVLHSESQVHGCTKILRTHIGKEEGTTQSTENYRSVNEIRYRYHVVNVSVSKDGETSGFAIYSASKRDRAHLSC